MKYIGNFQNNNLPKDVKEFGRKFTSELIEHIRNYQG